MATDNSEDKLRSLFTPKMRRILEIPTYGSPMVHITPEDHERIQKLRRWIATQDLKHVGVRVRTPSEVMTLAVARGVSLLDKETIARKKRQPLRLSPMLALEVVRLAQSSSMTVLALRRGLEDLEALREADVSTRLEEEPSD